MPINYSALAKVDPKKGVNSVKRDVTIDPGESFRICVVGPDGKPLAGARRIDLNGQRSWVHLPMKTAECMAPFNSRLPHDILVQHPEKGLVGVARPPKESGGSITVQLEPGAAITGRLVGTDGKPQAGIGLELSFRPTWWAVWYEHSVERIRTDQEGRFRFEALPPGYQLRLSNNDGELIFRDTLRSGQTKDLGDVRMKPEA